MDSINNACKFGSDAWLELQAFKTRQLNRREKLNRHKNLNQDLISGISINNQQQQQQQPQQSLSNNNSLHATSPTTHRNSTTTTISNTFDQSILDQTQSSSSSSSSTSKNFSNNSLDQARNINSNATQQPNNDLQSLTSLAKDNKCSETSELHRNHLINSDLIECLLILKLCDVALKLPIDSKSLQRSIVKIRGLEVTSQSLIENLLQKFAHQELITIEEPSNAIFLNNRRIKQIINSSNGTHNEDDDDYRIYITSADHTKLVEFNKSFGSLDIIRSLLDECKSNDDVAQDESDLLANNHQFNCSGQVQTIHRTNLANTEPNDTRLNDNNSRDIRKRLESCDAIEGIQAKLASIAGDSISSKSNDSKHKQIGGDDVESLLSLSSTRERENKKLGEELLELLSKPTAKERNLLERFRSADGYRVQEFCPKGTKGECKRFDEHGRVCDKLHFKKIIAKHTEESLGDCSFLNTCFHMDSCKYVHYEVDYDDKHQGSPFKKPHPADPVSSTSRQQQQQRTTNQDSVSQTSINSADNNNPKPSNTKDSNNNRSLLTSPKSSSSTSNSLTNDSDLNASIFTLSAEEQARIDAKNRKRFKTVLYPPQWIQCDLRFFDMSLLGKFSVVMADPPWDIHMELPYGTMSDDEMRKLNIPALQDDGVIFLWVTGRAMELGRECLALWGYSRCDEIIWVKTNQLQRIIRTGRTGHWLNHGKEHCLVGIKGNPKDINRGLDCDVIVAEVRATSHKPDEIYGIIERLSPGTRKIELFGRAHNVQPNWITLGNQLNGVRLVEPSLVNAFKKLNLPFQTMSDSVT